MSTCTARPNGPPSLSSLPRKLKERIAKFLDDLSLSDDDEDWEDDSVDGKDDEEGKEGTAGTAKGEKDGVLVTLVEDPEDARKVD
jgi:hypothetical protein